MQWSDIGNACGVVKSIDAVNICGAAAGVLGAVTRFWCGGQVSPYSWCRGQLQ